MLRVAWVSLEIHWVHFGSVHASRVAWVSLAIHWVHFGSVHARQPMPGTYGAYLAEQAARLTPLAFSLVAKTDVPMFFVGHSMPHAYPAPLADSQKPPNLASLACG